MKTKDLHRAKLGLMIVVLACGPLIVHGQGGGVIKILARDIHRPIGGAVIKIVGSHGSVLTDRWGQAKIVGLEVDSSYDILVTSPGFADTTLKSVTALSEQSATGVGVVLREMQIPPHLVRKDTSSGLRK